MTHNRELIRAALLEIIEEYPDHTWFTLLGFCDGYFGVITLEMVIEVQRLQNEGKIQA